MAKKQTAGRDKLGSLASKFAELFSAGLYPQLAEGLERFLADSESI